MSVFTPPVDTAGDPPVLLEGDVKQSASSFRLFRYYSSRPAGRNVYVYRAGTVSAIKWGQVTEADPITLYDSSGNMTTNGWDDLQVVFWGGHGAQTIDAAMVTLLTANGYASYIT